MMVYPINLLNSTAECDNLLREVTVEKGRISLRLESMKHDRFAGGSADQDPRLEREFCIDQIATHQAHLADMPEGPARAEKEMSLLRWQMRQKTLERQIRNTGPTAQNMDVLEIARLEAEISVIDAFIAQVNTHRDQLGNSTPNAGADLGRVA